MPDIETTFSLSDFKITLEYGFFFCHKFIKEFDPDKVMMMDYFKCICGHTIGDRFNDNNVSLHVFSDLHLIKSIVKNIIRIRSLFISWSMSLYSYNSHNIQSVGLK